MENVVNDETENVDIDTLKPHPRNPNDGDVDVIRKSIRENGWYGYIVCQKSTRRILAGEHSWRAAKKEGFDIIPVAWADVDDDTALRILLTDNKTAALADRDQDLVDEILDDLAKTDAGLQGTGYGHDPEIVDEILDDINEEEDNEDEVEFDVERDNTFRPVLDVEEIVILERAIYKTGIEHRGEALIHICKEYLEMEEDDFDVDELVEEII